jgi:hypothetical protein
MKLIVLDSTVKYVKARVLSNPATQPTFSSHYADAGSITFVPASQTGVLSGTSDVIICTAPGSGVRRIIRDINIFNGHSATITIVVELVNGANSYVIAEVTMNSKDRWTLTNTFDGFGIKTAGL